MTRTISAAALLLVVPNTLANELALRLENLKPQQSAGETPDIRLTLINDNDAPAYISPAVSTLQMEINDGNGWRMCHTAIDMVRGVIDSNDWRTVRPRGTLILSEGRFPCTTRSFRDAAQDWNMIPASYRLRVTMTHWLADATFVKGHEPPVDALDGALLSNEIALSVVAPNGADAEAFE